MEIVGHRTMSETKSDPPKRLRGLDAPASPTDGPDQQALAIIERAAREMATRRPRTYAPAPDEMPAVAAPVEPAKPFEESAPPVEVAPVQEINEEIKPIMAMDPVDEPASAEIATTVEHIEIEEPPEIATVMDSVNVRELAAEVEDVTEDTSVIELSEPVAEAAAAMQSELETLTTPAAIFAPTETVAPVSSTTDTSPKIVPPVSSPAQPKFAPDKIAPTKTPPAARPLYDDHFHLALTTAQSAAVAIAIFAFVMAAFGMAARGWVVARSEERRVGKECRL